MRAENNLSRWERWRYKGLERYQRRVINTRTGNVAEDYYFFPAGVGFYSLHRAPFGPDVVKMPGTSGYFPLTRKKPPQQFNSRARVKVFRSTDGRNLILSKDMEQAEDFTLFALQGKTYEPWINLPFALGARAYIEAAQLRDGRFVFAAKDLVERGPDRLVYYPPSRDGRIAEQELRYPYELIRQELLVTPEEKILVAAWLRVGFDRYFALFDPARKLEPIFLIGGHNTRPQEFDSIEVDGRLLMMVTTNSSQFQLYEPLVSSSPLVEIATGDTASSFGLFKTADGQLDFYFAGRERLRAFALTNVTRAK
jgi:hypothetical protein